MWLFWLLLPLLDSVWAQDVVWPSPCLFDERMSALRCRDADLRRVVQGLNDLAHEIHVVDANFCRLPVIDTPLFEGNTSKVTTVNLVNSELAVLAEDAFSGLEDSLEHLDLSGNLLETIPDAVLHLPRLVALDLSRNRIAEMPHGSAFNHLNTLVVLNLAENRLGGLSQQPASDSQSTRGIIGHPHQPEQQQQQQQLSLLAFNLEPLTDTLQELDLRGNGFTGLPKQLQTRGFARLRKLDLSHNPLRELPGNSFSGMPDLEALNLEHTQLRSFVLTTENALPHIKEFRLTGNPLRCDCRARWLWSLIRERSNSSAATTPGSFQLPLCATPFSVRGSLLTDLEDFELCELLPGDRRPRFFRVSDQDKSSFPSHTFDSLGVDGVDIISETQLDVRWHIRLDFYYTDYDWGVIFREIGDTSAVVRETSSANTFYKTKQTLANHIDAHSDWTPKSENLTAQFGGLKSNVFYEICLAVIDHSTVYYVHSNNCVEVRMPAVESSSSSLLLLPATSKAKAPSYVTHGVVTNNISFVPTSRSITVTWQVGIKPEDEAAQMLLSSDEDSTISLVRRISLRQFGAQENVTQLYVIEDFSARDADTNNGSRYYTLPFLEPETPYVICFDTLPDDVDVESREKSTRNLYCSEVTTLSIQDLQEEQEESAFPLKEVALATALSIAITVAVVAVLCCCCSRICCKSTKRSEKKPAGEHVPSGHNALRELPAPPKIKGSILKQQQPASQVAIIVDSGESTVSLDENENSKRVVMSEGPGETSVVDGIILQAGDRLGGVDNDEYQDDDDLDKSTRIDMSNSDDDDDDDDEDGSRENDISSQPYRSSSIISVVDNELPITTPLNKESIFQERYSMATLPRVQKEPNLTHSHHHEAPNRQDEDEADEDERKEHNNNHINSHGKIQESNLIDTEDTHEQKTHRTSAARRRRFWQSCLSPHSACTSGNSSLYSQYDYTVHSEATTAQVQSLQGTTDETEETSDTSENELKTDAETALHTQHNSLPGPHHHHVHRQHQHRVGIASEPLPPLPTSSSSKSAKSSSMKGTSSSVLPEKEVTIDPSHLGRHKHHHHHHHHAHPHHHYHQQTRFSSPNRKQTVVIGPPTFPDMSRSQHDSAPFLFHPSAAPLAAMGPGSYHTISHYQFYKRPTQAPAHPGFHPIYATPMPHSGYYAYPGPDFSKTLGRTRRESPMAMVPLPGHPHLVSPPAHSMPLPHPQGGFSLKRLKKSAAAKSAAGSGGGGANSGPNGANDNYKMYTWSPYSNPGPPGQGLFFAEGAVGQAYRLKRDAGKSMEDLRF